MTEAEQMCRGIPEPIHGRAVELAENILCMEQVLTDARDLVSKTPIVVNYNNGGGQKGIRKNPVHEMYNATMRQYVAAVDKFVHIVERNGGKVDDGVDSPISRILKAAGKG